MGVTFRVGLTGGIACGKSTVLGIFAECGAAVTSADDIVHLLFESDPDVRRRVRQAFGDGAFDDEGRVRTGVLADVVFSSDRERALLESILHPEVRRRISLWMQEQTAAGVQVAVAEVPLLFEAGFETDFDLTVVVAAEHELQLGRLTMRGMSRAEAEARVSAQMPLQRKAARGDVVLWNNGSLEELEASVRSLWTRIPGLEPRGQRPPMTSP